MHRVLIACCCLIAHESLAIEIIAHRGYSCDSGENTIAAVVNAWRAGADGVEIDVRVSKDGVVILYHDDEFKDEPISSYNFSDLRLGDEPIAASFQSVLELGTPPGYFVLDLKDSDADVYGLLVSLVVASDIEKEQFIFQSTSVTVLMRIKRDLPGSRFYFVSNLSRKFPFFLAPKPQSILRVIESHDIDGVSLKGRSYLSEGFVETIKGAGYRVNVWTINDPARAEHYYDISVDGIITDSVEVLRSRLESEGGVPSVCPDLKSGLP